MIRSVLCCFDPNPNIRLKSHSEISGDLITAGGSGEISSAYGRSKLRISSGVSRLRSESEMFAELDGVDYFCIELPSE